MAIVTNALVYFWSPSVTKKKSLITSTIGRRRRRHRGDRGRHQRPFLPTVCRLEKRPSGVNVIKRFSFVADDEAK
jgi:hypothetical protein